MQVQPLMTSQLNPDSKMLPRDVNGASTYSHGFDVYKEMMLCRHKMRRGRVVSFVI